MVRNLAIKYLDRNMSDIIQLLPDSVANQIAAGEVVQRPSSVVKELVENSIDSGAKMVKLIIKDAGRALIQVIDDGNGMSENDARLAFERHATSKITNAEELFAIRTKGFRGEALASIAAIAHVELKTRPIENDLGTLVEIEGSVIKTHEPCQCAAGTSFSVKNLFYNVPARRNFLKSDAVETKHILDEFQRIALPHPDIEFRMYHNEQELFHLKPGNTRQRLVAFFGTRYDERLVPVSEETDIVRIRGFVGKPEFARRTRGEQFFFVNNRFIKSNYLNHAVKTAFEGLIGEGQHPFYALHLEVDPGLIDVNIHPTKTEIKFQDERSIYAILRSSVKQALGKFSVAPSLDFEQETSIQIAPLHSDREVPHPSIQVNSNYNPFHTAEKLGSSGKSGGALASRFGNDRVEPEQWKALYAITEELEGLSNSDQRTAQQGADRELETHMATFQLHRKYIVTTIRSGMIIVDQQRAHERVMYEFYQNCLKKQTGSSQQLLFPQTITLSASDFTLVESIIDELHAAGFEAEPFGGKELIIRGVPAESKNTDPVRFLESVLEEVKNHSDRKNEEHLDTVALALARSSSIRAGQVLAEIEMRELLDQLFACELPYHSATGTPTIVTFTLSELEQKFKK